MVHEVTVESGGRRARVRARRLDEIIGMAREIVRVEGIEALTTHLLAKRLDLAVGALYRYFPSKSALVAELERQSLDALGKYLKQHLTEAEGAFRGRNAPLARVVLAGRVYARFAREHGADFGLIGQLLADPRVLVPGAEGVGLLAATMDLLGLVAALFTEATAEKAIGEGDDLERAVLYWSGLRGVLELAKLRAHSPGFDTAPLADAMARALLVGFGAEADAVGKAFSVVDRYEDKTDREDRR